MKPGGQIPNQVLRHVTAVGHNNSKKVTTEGQPLEVGKQGVRSTSASYRSARTAMRPMFCPTNEYRKAFASAFQ